MGAVEEVRRMGAGGGKEDGGCGGGKEEGGWRR